MSTVNIYLSKETNKLSNTICDQLNWLYFIDLLVVIVNTRSYYIIGGENMGYQLALYTTLIDFLLIIIVINETRLAPTKPIITESVSMLIYILYLLQLY